MKESAKGFSPFTGERLPEEANNDNAKLRRTKRRKAMNNLLSSDITSWVMLIITLVAITAFVIFIIVDAIKMRKRKRATAEQEDGLDKADDIDELDEPSEPIEYDEEVQTNEDKGGSCLGAFFALILKLILLAAVILFALVNYRRLSLTKGWTQKEVDEDISAAEAVLTLTGISKIEYYNSAPAPFTSEKFVVFIETTQENYIFTTDQDGIDAIRIAAAPLEYMFDKVYVEKITPVPYYVEVILGIIILALPIGSRRR